VLTSSILVSFPSPLSSCNPTILPADVPLQDYTSKNTSAVNREAIHSYRAEREKRQSKAGFRFGLAVLCGMFLLAAFGIEVYEMSEYGVTECAVDHDATTDIDITSHVRVSIRSPS
jgi:hypothetical protein